MKYYARIGSRFVQIKSVKGMFYNNDGTFTEKRTDKSIGICVHDDFEETIIASLNVSKNPATYNVAKSACKAAFPFGEGHIPSRKELFMAMEYKQYIDAAHCSLWTSESSCAGHYAWCLYWDDGFGGSYDKNINRCVLPFLTIKSSI